MASLQAQRQLIQRLIDDTNIVDAPTAYYALYHPAARTVLTVSTNRAGRPLGFAGRFTTGIDLFRPLVSLHARAPEQAAELLAELLTPGRPYIFFANQSELPLIGGSMQVENARTLRIYYLNSARFRPSINVLVTQNPSPDGKPRFEINGNEGQAVCGVNWLSPGFAEVYVHTDPAVRQRGWGSSVLSACTENLIRGGRQPIYLVEEGNTESIQLAESVGYVDSGGRQVFADVVYLGHPLQSEVPVDQHGEPQEDTGRR